MTTRASIIAVIPFLLFGCALPETDVEEPAPKPKPTVSRSTGGQNNEIPLRDPDVANELPDERLTGTGARTVGNRSSSGTVIARPPGKTSGPTAPPEEKP